MERLAEGFEGFEGGQTAVLNALKNRWLGRVAARVALKRLAEGFEALSGACSCESCLGKACEKLQEFPWKCLQKGFRGLRGLRAGKRVAARVALERPAEGFEALSGACRCESCLGKACGRV